MNKNNWSPEAKGKCIQDFLEKQKNKLSSDDIKKLQSETTNLLSNCVHPDDASQSKTLLSLGYIQSGKTLSMTTLMALAADNNFRMIVVLAGITNVLLNQTFDRLKKDLIDCGHRLQFDIIKNPSNANIDDIRSALKTSDDSNTTICLVILKHYKYLNNLADLFNDFSIKKMMDKKQVIIIDDEADQASLNGLAYKNRSQNFIRFIDDDNADYDYKKVYKEITTTYASINNLREAIGCNTYIQYTATPQSLLFIDNLDILSPNYIQILTPGEKYVGGKLFFKGHSNRKKHINKIPNQEIYHFRDNPLKSAPNSLMEAVRSFIILVAYSLIKNISGPQSMMIHPHQYNRIKESRIECAPSEQHYDWIKSIISAMRKDFEKGGEFLNELSEEFQVTHERMKSKIDGLPTFDIIGKRLEVSLSRIKVIPFYSNYDAEELGLDFDQKNNFYILIGGHKLNRGYTVEGLVVSYMPVSIGAGNADTIQQRCRFLGYKNEYIDLCQVYLPESSIEAYTDYVHHEEDIRDKIIAFYKNGGTNIKELKKEFILSDVLDLTRSNVLVNRLLRFNMKSWEQFRTIDQNYLENNNIFDKFISNYLKNPHLSNSSHLSFKIDSSKCLKFLSELQYNDILIQQKINTIIGIIKWAIKNDNINLCNILHMDGGKIRERSYEYTNSNHSVLNLHSGARAGYKGDGYEFDEKLFTIQLHRIKPRKVPDGLKFNNFYTLAIKTPEEFKQNLISHV